MGYYQITLLVTSEQENAIMELFRERMWSYQKTGQSDISADSQSSLARADSVSEDFMNDINTEKASMNEETVCHPLTEVVYTEVKTESSSFFDEYECGNEKDNATTTDCDASTSSVKPNKDLLPVGMTVDKNKVADVDKLDAVKTKVESLFRKGKVDGKMGSAKTKRSRRKCWGTRSRNVNVAKTNLPGNGNKNVNDLVKLGDKANKTAEMKTCKKDEIASDEDDAKSSLILFTDESEVSKSSSKAVKIYCDSCNFSFRKVKCYEKHKCKSVCPFCKKIFPRGRMGNFNKHVKFHEMKMKKASVNTSTDLNKINVFQSEIIETITAEKDANCTASQNAPKEDESYTTLIDRESLSAGMKMECQEYPKTVLTVAHENPNVDTAVSESRAVNETASLHCVVCNHTFKRKKTFDKHVSSNSCKRVCEFCGKIFLRRQIGKYTMHIKSHKKQKDHQCPTCGKCFYEKNYLLRHQRVVHGGEKPFFCDLCGASFSYIAGMWLHKKNKHDEARYPCMKCPKVFQSNSGLRYHRTTFHGEGEIHEFPCSTCGKVCRALRLLRKHEESHRTKDFKCNQCPSAFKTVSQLKCHTRRHEKAYSHFCKRCDKAFYTLRELQAHELTHTGEKPHACPLCDFRCAFGGNLNKHMRVHLKTLI